MLTDDQTRSIASLTIDGVRQACNCGICGRTTGIAVDGDGGAWWLCADCLARKLVEAETKLKKVEAVLVAADRVHEAYDAMLDGRDVGRLPDWEKGAA